MILHHIKILRGPNIWSNNRQNLIVVKLDIQKFEYLPSNSLPHFNERLLALMPSLYDHHCSEGERGGFISRLHTGTFLGHIIEHIALELQQLAGMDCNFGRTRSTHQKGVYHIVFEYEIEKAGVFAAKAAIRLVDSLANGKYYKFLENDILKLKKILSLEAIGSSTKAILLEAKKRNIPFRNLEDKASVMLGQGVHQQIFSAAVSFKTSLIAGDWASDKALTKKMLAFSHIPVPSGNVVRNSKQLHKVIETLGFPLVIKPINGNHGRGITININTLDSAINAYKLAKQISADVVVEKFIAGGDYRFLVIDKKMRAVGKRIPAAVVGDGQSSIKKLIENVNSDRRRGENHENLLTKIQVDDITLAILLENNLTLESVLPKGVTLYLKYAANLSAGGTSEDVTDQVHPDNIELAERVARLSGLDICGIDIIAKNISEPLNKDNGAVIEVNAGPGLRMHLNPIAGKKQDVAKYIMDYLYPEGSLSRIPIVAITGTNGKTTVARLIAKLASAHGYCVGLTTTDGIYINNKEIFSDDCSGPLSAKMVLRDPTVDFAVLECARGGILRSGLGFDKCNISIVTNISEDHLGIDDVEDLADLARVKEVVPRSTFTDGYAILNADDDLVFDLKTNLSCHIALFSIYDDNKRILQHSQAGGMAAYIKNNKLCLMNNHQAEIIIPDLTHLPSCCIKNILPAVLASAIAGFSLEKLRICLNDFFNFFENTPGRLNLFELNNCKILIDYAHNVGALKELKNYLATFDAAKKIGIIGVPGDRRDIDITNMGNLSAQIFDEIIIRHDKDNRGRDNNEITKLLQSGIFNFNTNLKVNIISDGISALEHAIESANNSTLIVFLVDDVNSVLTYLKKRFQNKKEIENLSSKNSQTIYKS